MDLIITILLIGYCLMVLIPLCMGIRIFFKMQRMPSIIDYVNLLHKHQDPEHPALRAIYLTSDTDFQRRAGTLHTLWEMKTTLPNYTQYLADIKPKHRDEMLHFIDTGEFDKGSELEHEVDTNPVYQKVLDDVIRLQTRRLQKVFDTLGMK